MSNEKKDAMRLILMSDVKNSNILFIILTSRAVVQDVLWLVLIFG